MEISTEIIIFSTILFIVTTLALRELNCRYWKINERIELQNKQNILLEQLISKVSPNSIALPDSSKHTSTDQDSVNDSEVIDQPIKDIKKNK